jgi:hypothetical protein
MTTKGRLGVLAITSTAFRHSSVITIFVTQRQDFYALPKKRKDFKTECPVQFIAQVEQIPSDA